MSDLASILKPRLPGEKYLDWVKRNEPWTREKCEASGKKLCSRCLEWSCYLKLKDEWGPWPGSTDRVVDDEWVDPTGGRRRPWRGR